MFYIATYDIGTTAVKGVLVREDGKIEAVESIEINTFYEEEYKEQDPQEWFEAFCRIGKIFSGKVKARDISAIIMSGQMQDMILTDRNGDPIRNAILYSDVRAQKEAETILERIPEDRAAKITGNNFDGSMPLAKLLWVKENEPEIYDKAYKIFISSKDYIINKITGVPCGDYTACSTAGAMNIEEKIWDEEMISAAQVRQELFAELKYPHEVAGNVKEELTDLCGYAGGTVVYTGIGDAGATTLASGISRTGDYNINIGTSGWVASVSDEILELKGRVFNLAGFTEQTYINVVPFFNAGNVHKWITKIFSEAGSLNYTGISRILNESEPGAHGVLFLPYLTGERFPVIDADIKGCFYGITPDTSREDLVRACLEGVGFSVRQGLELISSDQKSISLIGGGAREEVWCQIIADILGKDVTVYKDSDIMPAKAIAAAALLGEGKISDYNQFIRELQEKGSSVTFHVSWETHKIYNQAYEKYKKLYPSLARME